MCVLPDRACATLVADRSLCCDSIRILYMPAVYAIISFFSYRFFRSYTYYELIETGALPFFSSLIYLVSHHYNHLPATQHTR